MMPETSTTPRPWRLLALLFTLCEACDLSASQGDSPRAPIPLTRWMFQPGTDINVPPEPADWAAVEVPFLWTATWRYKVNKAGKSWEKLNLREADSGWFETRVAVPETWANKMVYLELSGVHCDAVVWVNGRRLAELRGPDGRVNIMPAAAPGKDAQLRLWVTRWWQGTKNQRENDPLRDSVIKGQARTKWFKTEDDVRRGIPAGLRGKAALRAAPAAGEIQNVRVDTSVRHREIRVHVKVAVRPRAAGLRLEAQVTELDGSAKGLPSLSAPLETAGTGERVLTASWPQPRLWEVGDAYLYRLQVRLVGPNGPLQEFPSVRFGFREVWTEGRELVLNGHPLRLRLPYFVSSVPQMIFFEGMGFNAMEFQPNPTAWYGTWGLFPAESTTQAGGDLLDAADERGWAVLMPAPGVSYIRSALQKPAAQALYLKDFQAWMNRRDRQNRPSILAWIPSMNTAGNYNPQKLGRKPKTPPAAWYAKVEELLKSADPSRLVFHHQGGQTGDMEMSNFYLNFVPLQEREEFLSAWNEHGEKPWGAVEHGPPFVANFFKRGVVPYFTEYAAIYFGDRAYAREKDAYVEACQKLKTLEGTEDRFAGVRAFSKAGDFTRVGEWTGYYRFMDLFIRHTNKAWRGWGANGGWFPWSFNIGFGVPPGYKPSRNGWYMYESFKKPDEKLKRRPDWASPLYDAYRDTMQPLLVFVGGQAKRFTAEDHSFYAGEPFEKSIVVVWDGPGRKRLNVDWESAVAGEPCAEGREEFSLAPGAIEKRALRLTAPQVAARTAATLRIAARDAAGKVVARDRFSLAVFPRVSREPRVRSCWRLFDPAGETAAELKRLGLSIEVLQPGDDLQGVDVLVVGAKALSRAKRMPFKLADIERGLRVLVFEQDVPGLEALGFRVQDVVPRYVFPRVPGHPILRGVEPADLINWRGAGRLLPATSEGMKVWPWPHAPHWGNAMSVASVVIETPHRGAFTPLLECEFDLAYSPLLLWEDGRGRIVFCQLDLSGRLGHEPAADLIARNLVTWLDAEPKRAQVKRVVLLRNAKRPPDFADGLGFEQATRARLRPSADIAVIGPDGLAGAAGTVRVFVRAGGTAFVLPQNKAQLQTASLPWRLATEPKKMARVPAAALRSEDPLLRGIGPQLVHWRTFLDLNPFAKAGVPAQAKRLLGGLVLEVPDGGGRWVFCQLDWRSLEDGSDTLRRARWNAHKLYRQLLCNLGAKTRRDTANQFLSPRNYAPMTDVSLWQVLDEISEVATDKGERNEFLGLRSLLPAERWVQKPDATPETRFEWRLRGADKNGYFDFTRLAPAKEGRVGYAVTHIYASVPRRASFTLSSDYWCVFRVNGAPVVDQGRSGRAHRAPRPGEISIRVPLKKGWNRLEMKVASGSSGFGFWCQVSDPGDLRIAPCVTVPGTVRVTPPRAADLLKEPAVSDVSLLYREPLEKEDDPYGFTPW